MHLTVSFVQACAKKVILAVLFSGVLLSGIAAGEQTHYNGIEEKVGQAVPPDLVFYDEKGEKVSLQRLTDKPALISLVYFSCGSVCPLLLGNLAETLGKTDIDPRDYRVLTISFDDRDTPAVALGKKRNYLKAIGRPFPESSWQFLTGDKKTIKRFTESVGFAFREEKGGFSHPRALVFLSPGGRIVRYLYGMTFSPFDIKMSLKEASARSSFFSADNLALFCYHYDPEENRYVFNLARSSAAVLLLFITSSLLLIVLLRRKGGGK